MNEIALTESRTLREQHRDRADVLDKVKALRLMPDGMHASVSQTASYYEVSEDAIEWHIRTNRDELDEDGMQVLTGNRLSEFKAESGYQSRAASLTLLPRRAILRVGMLLRDSEIARQVRTYLLDAEDRGGDLDELEVAERYVAAIKANRALKAELTEARPKADSWNVLASGQGDFSVADAAKILSRDPAISIGRDRLFGHLADDGWVYRQQSDGRRRAYQAQVNTGRLSELPQTYENTQSGRLAIAAPQVRVTPKGLHELHRRLGGVRQLQIGGGAA